MLCPFCSTDYDENLSACPNCGKRPEGAVAQNAEPALEKAMLDPWTSFCNAVKSWGRVSDRASRREFVLVSVIALACLGALACLFYFLFTRCCESLDDFLAVDAFFLIVGVIGAFFLVLPFLVVVVRRLHDIGLNVGVFCVFACLLGAAVFCDCLLFWKIVAALCVAFFLFLCVWPGRRGANKYGPNPRYVVESSSVSVETDAALKNATPKRSDYSNDGEKSSLGSSCDNRSGSVDSQQTDLQSCESNVENVKFEPGACFRDALKHWRLIKDRACRREMIYFSIVVFEIYVAYIIASLYLLAWVGESELLEPLWLFLDVIAGIGSIVLAPAAFALAVRRLHDIGISGWALIALPVALCPCAIFDCLSFWGIGVPLYISFWGVLCVCPSRRGANKYGPDPRYVVKTSAEATPEKN